MDQLLLGDSSYDDDGLGQLEIADFQAQEIRSIFLATLPEYLEPVRQMVRQLVSTPEDSGELRATLDTTLESLGAAAAKVDVHDAQRVIERARARLSSFGGTYEPELEDALLEDLRELESLTAVAQTSSRTAPPPDQGETLFAAFTAHKELDRSALERLTQAGLLSVRQLLAAEPGEIVAVSGLEPAKVQAILDALRGGPVEVPAPPAPAPAPSAKPAHAELLVAAAQPAPRPPVPPLLAASLSALEVLDAGSDAPALAAPEPSREAKNNPVSAALGDAMASPVLSRRASVADPAGQLKAQLSTQVEAEMRLEELRAGILAFRTRLAKLREDGAVASHQRNGLRDAVARRREELGRALAELVAARSRRDELETRRDELERAASHAEEELTELRRRGGSVAENQRALSQDIRALIAGVSAKLRASSAAGPRRPVRPSARRGGGT